MPWISGKHLAEERRSRLRDRLANSDLTPTLAVLLVGDDPASALYVNLKERAAQEVGIHTVIDRRAQASTEELITQLQTWNEDTSIHGILVQLPLPAGIDTERVMQAIDPRKDADGFHPDNRTALVAGNGQIFPPVYTAVLLLLAASHAALQQQKTLILAKSDLFGEPLQAILQRAGAFVTRQDALPDRSRLAEYRIIITALDQPGSLHGADLDEQAIIIDISTIKTPSGVVGDFLKESLRDTQEASPVPGGVGPLTIACLLENVVQLAEQQARRS